jgi:hypothetical protein
MDRIGDPCKSPQLTLLVIGVSFVIRYSSLVMAIEVLTE